MSLDIIQSTIMTSDYWVDTSDDTTKQIKFCLRLDLLTDDETLSVNFFESKVTLDIDMAKGFDVVGVQTDRDNATVTDKNASLDYTILAFETNDDGDDLTGDGTQYTQGDFLQIAVTTNGTGVKVADVIEMTLTGDTVYKSIDDASPSALTARDCSGAISNGCKVKTMLVSNFFVNANPSPINVTGKCVLEFARSRRLTSFRGRDLQASDDTDAEFGLSVPLKPMDIVDEAQDEQDEIEMTASAAASAGIIVGMASFVVAVFSFFLM